MAQKSKGWIGIDLGARAIKIAQVERGEGGLRMSGAAVVERETALQSAGVDIWSPRLIRAALSLEPAFRGRASACLLSLAPAGIRMLNVPPGTDAERRAMIGHQLEENLGIQVSQYEIDFWDCGEPSDTQGTHIGVAYVDRASASVTACSITKAGLSCQVLDGAPLAAARAADLAGIPPGQCSAVVDWGYSNATMTVVIDGVPRFFRSLRSCGFASMLDAVGNALDLTNQDAQQLLTMYGIEPGQSRDATCTEITRLLADITGHALLNFEQQLDTTLNHLRLHRTGLVPERFILAGGGATVRGIEDELASRLEMPVELWRLPVGDSDAEGFRSTPQPMLACAAALSALAWN